MEIPMEVRLSPVSGLSRTPSTNPLRGLAKPAAETNFQGALNSALKSVSSAQNKAGALQKEVLMENPKVSLEETMVAMQSAQISFQSALHVRNRMVQAYTDIMNMQV
jgi:flagellar hook-basal body complex protein FliE